MAAQFHAGPAGKTTTEHRIEFHNSAWLKFDGGTVLKPFQSPSDETGSDFSSCETHCGHGVYSLFVRLCRILARNGPKCQVSGRSAP